MRYGGKPLGGEGGDDAGATEELFAPAVGAGSGQGVGGRTAVVPASLIAAAARSDFAPLPLRALAVAPGFFDRSGITTAVTTAAAFHDGRSPAAGDGLPEADVDRVRRWPLHASSHDELLGEGGDDDADDDDGDGLERTLEEDDDDADGDGLEHRLEQKVYVGDAADECEYVMLKSRSGDEVSVALPREWLRSKIEPLWVSAGRTRDDILVVGRLRDSGRLVVLKEESSQSRGVKREVGVVRRLGELRRLGLRASGCVLPYYGVDVTRRAAFFMTELEVQNLAERLGWRAGDLMGEHDDRSARPLGECLRFLVQVLRGLQELEGAGILHLGISPYAVSLARDQVFVSGLHSGCLLHDGDPELSCSALPPSEFEVMGSPLWQPPELTSAGTIDARGHVWGAGLLFAATCLGYNPAAHMPSVVFLAMSGYGRNLPERRSLRLNILHGFNLSQDWGFQRLDADVQVLLAGMLEKEPEKRWDTARALEVAATVAASRGIPLPPDPRDGPWSAGEPPATEGPWPNDPRDGPSVAGDPPAPGVGAWQ